ncbi:DUF58 domain-containing protein [Thermococcus sp. M39]|uniref:DUF58 domain-containing protein n=1 Tax=unclassified Thermococcus TaxID=2627626 RepID=UPI00143A945B|nr:MULTISPECIES: DUF58 domain-containing protein [unclassified Thermococcus]NJE06973.1 DUF58 domain-containing protein [Thermococcus sp. M39]NJE12867.1 DUF58 domain-containing protein [Thermococcus sp. LS2]
MEREDLLFILASLLFIQGFLFVNVVPALLGLGIILYIANLRLSFSPRVYGRRVLSESRTVEGKPLKALLIVKNNSKIPLKVKVIEDNPDFESESVEVFLNPNEEKRVEYFLRPRKKGSFKIKGSLLKVKDLRDLYYEEFRAEGEFTVDVYPSVESIKEASKVDRNVRLAEKALTQLHTGMESVEIHGLREFQPGDDTRHIDWKATARLGELIVREFLREFKGDIYLLVDGSKEMRRELKKSKVDYLSLLISQIGYYLLSKNCRVGLVLFDDVRVLKFVRATGTKEQVNNLLNALKISPLKGIPSLKVPKFSSRGRSEFLRKVMPFLKGRKSYYSGIIEASSSIPFGSFAIIVTDIALRPKELAVVIENLKKNKSPSIVISINPILFLDLKDLNRENIPTIYKHYVEREELIRKMNVLVPVIEVGPADLIREVVEAMR